MKLTLDELHLEIQLIEISLETIERFFSREEKIEISREPSWDTWNSPRALSRTETIPPATQATPFLNFIHEKRPKIIEKFTNIYGILIP